MPTVRHAAAVDLEQLQEQYLESLLHCRRDLASQFVLGAVDAGAAIGDIYLEVFQPTLYEVGRLWQAGDIGIAQEHYCTAATQLIMSQLYPRIFTATEGERPTLIAAGLSGELHEIGVRMVADLLQIDGWDTHYLGTNTPGAEIVDYAAAHGVDLLALSLTCKADLEEVREVIGALRRLAPGARVLLGGQILNRTPDLWRQLGGDGYAPDARQAVGIARGLRPG